MKFSKTTVVLLSLSAIVVVFNLARLEMWGTTDLFYLFWNLFLAWIPYIISSYFIKEETSIKYFIPLFILWILFFPNAPYLVTDVLHIAGRVPTLLWYDSLLFFFFGWVGLLLGIISLAHIHKYLRAHFSILISEISILIICFVSSFGIYLGRFERWNSWDIFTNPFDLIKHSFDIFTNIMETGTLYMFVLVFTIFLYSVYKSMHILLGNNKGIESQN